MAYDSFDRRNVLVVSLAAVIVVVTIAVIAMLANAAADRHRERSEKICTDHGYQWVKEDCLYPPRRH